MQTTYEAKLSLLPEEASLLVAHCEQQGRAFRTAWNWHNRDKLSESDMYHRLTKQGFTSHQAQCLAQGVIARHKALHELKLTEKAQLESAIRQRESALREKRKTLATLQKQLDKQATERAKLYLKGKTRATVLVLATIRKLKDKVASAEQWIYQKARVLAVKQVKLAQLKGTLDKKQYSLCFGSKALFRQHPRSNKDSPCPSVEDWRQAWEQARAGQVWSIGAGAKDLGNREIQWDPRTGDLRIRLTDTLAEERMARMEEALGQPISSGPQKVSPIRMACRFLTIPAVEFPRAKATEHLREAVGKQPITYRLLQREGTFYLQASLAEALPDQKVSRLQGMLGVDLNKRGLAWCAVQADGNPIKGEHGFLPWDLQGKTTEQRHALLSEAATWLVTRAETLGVGIALENLDFSGKKAGAKAGYADHNLNEALGAMPTQQLVALLGRKAGRAGLPCLLVNPLYSSVGGFAKYGIRMGFTVDESASLWIARQGLRGEVYGKRGSDLMYCKSSKERFALFCPAISWKQSKKGLAGQNWKSIALALGRNRSRWGNSLREWLYCKVVKPLRDISSDLPEERATSVEVTLESG